MGPLEIKILVIFGILNGLEQANAINCYSCTKCNDPFDSSGVTIVQCVGNCYKVKSKDSGEAMRGCFAYPVEFECSDGKFSNVGSTVCSCSGNLCNYALSVGSSIIVMTAAMIVYVGLR